MSMTIRSSLLVPFALLVAALLAGAPPARAQGDLFAPAVFVNDRVITRYEIEQNRLFLTLLRQPGNTEELAVERLIEDRLRLDAAQAAGITATPEEIDAGMAEFASRVNLSTEEFITAIGQAGVAPETFRAFVEAGLLWRNTIRARFGPRAQVTDAEVDRAMALAQRQSGVQVLISELVLPANTPAAAAASEGVAARLAGQTLSEDAFAAEARARSVSPSRARGGRLDWLPIGNLPPQVAQQVIGLAPGQVSQPYPVQDAIILFYLRDLRETDAPEAEALAVDWAEYDVASAAEARRIEGELDTCDDLYGVAKGQPETRLRREVRSSAEVPADVATALAALDDNEVSTDFARGGRPVLLMLCARTFVLPGTEIADPATPPAPPPTAIPGEGTEAADGGDGGAAPADTAEAPPPPPPPVPPTAAPADPEAPAAEAGGPTREQVRNQLVSQRLASYADGYLAELLADATIRYQ